jgi:hypothetical protein
MGIQKRFEFVLARLAAWVILEVFCVGVSTIACAIFPPTPLPAWILGYAIEGGVTFGTVWWLAALLAEVRLVQI